MTQRYKKVARNTFAQNVCRKNTVICVVFRTNMEVALACNLSLDTKQSGPHGNGRAGREWPRDVGGKGYGGGGGQGQRSSVE